jgi:hypothetical protein
VREACRLELATSSLPRSRGLAGGPPPRGAKRDGHHRGAESPASPSRPSEALRRLDPPRLELPAEASVEGKVDRLSFDT